MVGTVRRNDPCWCGSGKKFKKCHLDREEMPLPPIQTVLTEIRKPFDKKYCLHPDAGTTTCRGKIIRAHTIQRNGGLSRIARAGHVYSFMGNDLMSLAKTGGILAPKLVGLAPASTFTGFCGYHDNAVFEPIEKHPFQANQEHTFLLAYRVLCRELFGKKAQDELIPFHRTLDQGRDALSQIVHQSEVTTHAAGVRAGLRDTEHYKSIYDQALVSGDYSEVRFYVVRFGSTPDVLCSAGQFPSCDFEGNRLQDLGKLDEQLDHLAFSIIATETGGAAVFSWVGESTSAERLVKSLHSQSDEQVPQSLVRYVFEFFENSYFSPDWWDRLDEKIRGALERRFNIGANPFERREPTCLVDDGLRPAAWLVCSRESNIVL